MEHLKDKLKTSDTIVIGAGAGLSTSAGFTYSGERFQKYFSDFEEKYGFHDMYAGGFYPYSTPEEYWAFWSRNITVNRYMDAPKPVYQKLFEIVKDKDYFVITTNVDHCFQKAGFDKKRLFYTQGDYGLFQCSEPCCNETFDNEKMVRQMMEQQKDMRIPSALLPKCPHCGKPLTMNLRADDTFVEDEGWHLAAERYQNFLRTRHISSVCAKPNVVSFHKSGMSESGKVLFLELGVGYNTLGIIKYPFWQMTAENRQASYACINYGEAVCPKEIESQSICMDGDIGDVLSKLAE